MKEHFLSQARLLLQNVNCVICVIIALLSKPSKEAGIICTSLSCLWLFFKNPSELKQRPLTEGTPPHSPWGCLQRGVSTPRGRRGSSVGREALIRAARGAQSSLPTSVPIALPKPHCGWGRVTPRLLWKCKSIWGRRLLNFVSSSGQSMDNPRAGYPCRVVRGRAEPDHLSKTPASSSAFAAVWNSVSENIFTPERLMVGVGRCMSSSKSLFLPEPPDLGPVKAGDSLVWDTPDIHWLLWVCILPTILGRELVLHKTVAKMWWGEKKWGSYQKQNKTKLPFPLASRRASGWPRKWFFEETHALFFSCPQGHGLTLPLPS